MNNLILEMKNIVENAKDKNLSPPLIRIQLKEYLHYFVLDFIYNSAFKEMIFYGGGCLRILYDLPRMSEDLDFEAGGKNDIEKLAKELEAHFKKDLKLKESFSVKKSGNINRIFLSFPIMAELGLSPHQEEALKIKLEVCPVKQGYLKRLQPVLTPKTKYGKVFIIKHYDLPTLFASKLAAILGRPKKGFHAGKPDHSINYKGRDFYDLIWYMEKRVLPNEEMLKLNNIKSSISEVFEEIGDFIARMKLPGLKRDLEPLFASQNFVENFVRSFQEVFQYFKDERYKAKKIKDLEEISIADTPSKIIFRFVYLCASGEKVSFVFVLSTFFLIFKDCLDIQTPSKQFERLFNRVKFKKAASKVDQGRLKKYAMAFLFKIDDYLKRHRNEVYFDKWESRLIVKGGHNFNPEKEVSFPRAKALASRKVKLEYLGIPGFINGYAGIT